MTLSSKLVSLIVLLASGGFVVGACASRGSLTDPKTPGSPTAATDPNLAASAFPNGDATNGNAAVAPPGSPGAATPAAALTAESANGDAMPPIPDKCTDGQADDVCAPSAAFVRWLCAGHPKPDIALTLFVKDSPWTRLYLNRNTTAWYTSGPDSTKVKMAFDEEIIVLHHAKNGGGMIVNQGASEYDALKWDGVCVSLGSEELTKKHPPVAKHPMIPWQYLERNVKDALDRDPEVLKADIARKNECHGSTTLGMMPFGCVKAVDKLTEVIAGYVSHGGKVPLPKTGN